MTTCTNIGGGKRLCVTISLQDCCKHVKEQQNPYDQEQMAPDQQHLQSPTQNQPDLPPPQTSQCPIHSPSHSTYPPPPPPQRVPDGPCSSYIPQSENSSIYQQNTPVSSSDCSYHYYPDDQHHTPPLKNPVNYSQTPVYYYTQQQYKNQSYSQSSFQMYPQEHKKYPLETTIGSHSESLDQRQPVTIHNPLSSASEPVIQSEPGVQYSSELRQQNQMIFNQSDSQTGADSPSVFNCLIFS